MTASRTSAFSPYMEFAKLRSSATYNLATSGIASYPLAALALRIGDLEINGDTVYGFAPLQERIARKNGVSPDCVVAAAGTSMANHLAMAASFDPGDEVLIEEPTYELLLSAARYLGAGIRRFPRRPQDGFQILAEDVRRHITSRTRLVVLTNLHNPSGALVPDRTLAEVGDIARSVGARVLVDEVYREAVFEQPTRSAFHLGENFIATNSLTKAYGLSGLRCGWILAQPDLARRIWRINDLYGATPVHPAELLSVAAFDALDRVRDRAASLLAANRPLLWAFLDAHPRLECFRPPFGTVAFPRVPHGDADALLSLLQGRYDTSVVPGRFFEMPQHFRIGIGGETAMTGEGLRRLAAALKDLPAA